MWKVIRPILQTIKNTNRYIAINQKTTPLIIRNCSTSAGILSIKLSINAVVIDNPSTTVSVLGKLRPIDDVIYKNIELIRLADESDIL